MLTSQQSFCYSNLNKRFSHLAREAVQAANNSASSGNSAIGGRSTNKRMLRMQSLQSMCLTDQDHQAKTNFFNLSVGSATTGANSNLSYFTILKPFSIIYSFVYFHFLYIFVYFSFFFISVF